MTTDRNGLDVLSSGECLRLLSQSTLGRIGVSMGALPAILPVNFLVHGDRILIRTTEGTKLDAALHGSVVAFEVDDFDPVYHSGWSVMVNGIATAITDRSERERLEALPLPHWGPQAKEHMMAISMERVTGRRIPMGHVTGH